MRIQAPVIDLTGLLEGDGDSLVRVAAELRSPCERLGVFHVTGHGLSAEDFETFDFAMRQIFALPESEKERVRRSLDNARGYYDRELTKNRADWKEVFDFGAERAPEDLAAAHSDGRNRWPEACSESKSVLIRHYASCERIALALLRALSLSLGYEPDRLDPFFVGHSSFVRLNYYRKCTNPAPPNTDWLPDKGHLGVHHHTDAGALTILYQDTVAGLQARTKDGFALVEPVRGAFTVNLGDMLQVWSNDRYRSPIHRVLANSEQERFSAPFFLNPHYDAICEPLVGSFDDAERPRFRPIPWADFRDQRSAGDYDDYGDEIQIDDFRLGWAN